MTTIVRFDCGCIGTEPINGVSAILDACDGDGPGAIERNMDRKQFAPVDYREELWTAVNEARRYRELRDVLRRTVEVE